MTDAERAEIERLATQVCTSTERYNNGDKIPCENPAPAPHGFHWSDTYCCVWPDRAAS